MTNFEVWKQKLTPRDFWSTYNFLKDIDRRQAKIDGTVRTLKGAYGAFRSLCALQDASYTAMCNRLNDRATWDATEDNDNE